jgi:hypothetical protein
MRPAIRAAATIALAVLVVAGCGGPTRLKTKGRILKDGVPFRPGPGELVHVIFIPVVEAGRAKDYFAAEVNAAEGTFQVAGKDLKGMPPGKYRIWVEILKNKKDVLQGAFDEDHTPLVQDVDAQTDEVVIDLGKRPG